MSPNNRPPISNDGQNAAPAGTISTSKRSALPHDTVKPMVPKEPAKLQEQVLANLTGRNMATTLVFITGALSGTTPAARQRHNLCDRPGTTSTARRIRRTSAFGVTRHQRIHAQAQVSIPGETIRFPPAPVNSAAQAASCRCYLATGRAFPESVALPGADWRSFHSARVPARRRISLSSACWARSRCFGSSCRGPREP